MMNIRKNLILIVKKMNGKPYRPCGNTGSYFFNGGNLKMKKRSCAGLILDFILTIMTGGLWLIWILIRYLRNS